MSARVLRLSVGFLRSKRALALAPGSTSLKAILATLGEIAARNNLPGPNDFETEFAPGRAHVRRVVGFNFWVLYRFDATYVDILTVRTSPPVPYDSTE